MTRTELIGLANFAGFDVDTDDDVHAPASGRYGLDPKLVRFAQLVSDSMTLRQKTKFYQQGYEAGKIDARVAKPWVGLTDEEILILSFELKDVLSVEKIVKRIEMILRCKHEPTRLV